MSSITRNNSLVTFAEHGLGVSLNRHQRRTLEAIMRCRRVAIASCHATGKSFSLACAALAYAALHRDSRVLIITPGWLMNRAVIWTEIHSLLARAKHQLPVVSSTQTEIRLGPKNLIIGLSAADAGRLQGHHSANLLVIVDEAAALPADFWAPIEGVLASGNSRLVISGNPTTTSGVFYDAFARNRAAYECIQIGAFQTDNLENVSLERLLKMTDAELDNDVRPYLISRRWTRERYFEWYNGSVENSPLWQARVLGQFPTSSSNALVPLGALEAARRRPEDRGERIVIGVDPAGPGKDLTASVAVAGGAILETATFSDADARGPVVAFIKRHQPRLRLVNIDSAGIGWYLMEHLRSLGFPTQGLNAASRAKDPERYTNAKAERFFALRQRFMRGEISGLDDSTFAELASISYLVDAHGKIAIEAKESVKSTLGHSPDRSEALMLAAGETYQPIVWTPAVAMRRSSVRYVSSTDPRGDRESDCAQGELVAWREDQNAGRSEFGKLHRNSARGRALRWL